MYVEEGHWVIEKPLYPAPNGFRSRVMLSGIETTALARTKTGLPPVLRWCLDSYGSSGWTFDYRSTYDDPENQLNMILYFASHDDALAFYLRWS